jgi:DNA-binding XRE family transcriptional regulator
MALCAFCNAETKLYSNAIPICPKCDGQRLIDCFKTESRQAAEPTVQASSDGNSIGIQLTNYREECRLTIEQLAEAVDIDPRSVHRHMSGDAEPRIRHIAAYERAFSKALGRKVIVR